MHSAFSGRSTKTNHHTAKDESPYQNEQGPDKQSGRFHKPLRSNEFREFLLDLVALSPLPPLAAEL